MTSLEKSSSIPSTSLYISYTNLSKCFYSPKKGRNQVKLLHDIQCRTQRSPKVDEARAKLPKISSSSKNLGKTAPLRKALENNDKMWSLQCRTSKVNTSARYITVCNKYCIVQKCERSEDGDLPVVIIKGYNKKGSDDPKLCITHESKPHVHCSNSLKNILTNVRTKKEIEEICGCSNRITQSSSPTKVSRRATENSCSKKLLTSTDSSSNIQSALNDSIKKIVTRTQRLWMITTVATTMPTTTKNSDLKPSSDATNEAGADKISNNGNDQLISHEEEAAISKRKAQNRVDESCQTDDSVGIVLKKAKIHNIKLPMVTAL